MIRIRPAGDAALLLETDLPQASGDDDGNGAALLAAVVRAAALPGVTDVVPGAATVLVSFEPGSPARAELASLLDHLPAAPGADWAGERMAQIDVLYDGPDLAEVARLTGVSTAEVVARHQAGRYRVGWLGFSPGFGYLTGLDPVLAAVPRLATPRVAVPAGAVAIAGGLAAVYPAASPGGWRLLGHTAAVLWDPERDPPAMLAPGMRVRFRAVESLPAGTWPAGTGPANTGPAETGPTGGVRLAASEPVETGQDGPAARVQTPPAGRPRPGAAVPGDAVTPGGRRLIQVLQPGPRTTIQDLGRPGLAHLGVPASGAADTDSLRLANRLAGNEDGTACLEVTLGRLALRFDCDAVAALAGAPAPMRLTRPGGEPTDPQPDTAFAVSAGSVLRLGAPGAGLRSYLAIGGGIDVAPVLGSRSADCLSGLGPGPLRPGEWLPVAQPRFLHKEQSAERRRAVRSRLPATTGDTELRVVAGPRDDWFTAAALAALAAGAYEVTAASDRTGLRLAGPPLRRRRTGELPSEGVATGSLQVTHDGQPILLLADHPTTGGYPVIAVVVTGDIGLAAQLRPGQRIRFRLSGAERAP